MRVLVTGGLGFIGQAVTRTLLAHGHQVAVLTSTEHLRGPLPEGAQLVQADITDRAAITTVVTAGRFEGVCHLAALTKVRDSFTDPLRYFDVNVTGTTNLLHALDTETQRTGQPTRIVFSSTHAVYGITEGTLTETAPTLPANPYGASKLAAEQAISFQADTGQLGAVILRCFNIAGAVAGLGDHDLTRIIPKTLDVAAGTTEHLEINGDGSAIREYTHVLDIAEAFRLALDSAATGKHPIYNVGTGQGVTLAEVLTTARTITGRPIPAEHRPPKPEARVLMADASRIRNELGWNPQHSALEQILRDGWAARA